MSRGPRASSRAGVETKSGSRSCDALASRSGRLHASGCAGAEVTRSADPGGTKIRRAQRAVRGVGEIGFSIGYESEAAFSRAYEALFEHSPRVEYRLREGV
jgi:AraC-like DNA-binding protein